MTIPDVTGLAIVIDACVGGGDGCIGYGAWLWKYLPRDGALRCVASWCAPAVGSRGALVIGVAPLCLWEVGKDSMAPLQAGGQRAPCGCSRVSAGFWEASTLRVLGGLGWEASALLMLGGLAWVLERRAP